MKTTITMLAGTALALCLAGTPAWAGTVRPGTADSIRYDNPAGMLMLAQAEDEGAVEPQEEPRRKKRRADAERPARAETAAGEEPPRKKRRAEARAEEPAAREPARAEEQPRNKKRRVEVERRAQADAAAEEEQPRKKRRAETRAEEPAAREPARAEEQPRKKRRADAERRAQADTPAAEEPARAEEQPRKKRRTDTEQPAKAEPPSAEEPSRAEEQPRKKRRTDAEQPAQTETPSAEDPARAEEQPRKKRRTDAEQPAQAETPSAEEPARAEEQPRKKRRTDAEQPAQAETPSAEEPARAEEQPRRQRGTDTEPDQAETERPATAEPADETVRADEQNRRKNRRPRDGGKAPILDSAKQEPADAERPRRTEAAAPPPVDDRAAQAERIDRRKLARADSEKGQRIDREKARERRRERPEGSDVLREIGDRVVIQLGDQIMVEDRDRGRRIRRDARNVYYEELPRGRQREIVERRDGTRIVTIRDSYGDVIRRSRFEPDGNEIILAYVDEDVFERDDRDGAWYDPGRDLPPLELTIPTEEYILDAGEAADPDVYYAFLDQPPVEKIQRYYSVDEVKRSARIRDTVRRVDLDTITFGFGSAEIAEGEVQRLDNVAQAMEKLLKQNPAETFLIEGHTDAVGSDVANLALSDRRAEAVAQALTDVFEIPPENLETQGYGEEYLKVNVDGPERENRRVSIRRITPLVAPVASAE